MTIITPPPSRFQTLLGWTVGLALFATFAYHFALGPAEIIVVAVLLILLFGNRMPPGAKGGIHTRRPS